MKKQLTVPKFKTEDEERDFWASTDVTDYADLSDFHRVIYPNLKQTTQPISLRLSQSVIARLKQKANKLTIPYQSLIKLYIENGLSSDK